MKDYEVELEASFRKINEGDVIQGTVIDVNENEVTLDLKYYTQGIIKAEDMSNDPGFSVLNDVKIGDVVEASVVKMDDGQGNILLSKKEANEVLAWDVLERYLEEKTELTVKVSEIVKAGAVAWVEGIRGFIPASQLDISYVEDFERCFRPEPGIKAVYRFQIDDGEKIFIIEVDGPHFKCYYGNVAKADVDIKVSSDTMNDIVFSKMTFQKAFMSGNMKTKGDFKLLRALDQMFVFQ